MWLQTLWAILSSNLTKEVVTFILDKIAESNKNNATKEDTDKLKEVL